MDQAHIQVTDPGAVLSLEEQGVLSVKDRPFEHLSTDVIVYGRFFNLKKKRQFGPVFQHVGNRLSHYPMSANTSRIGENTLLESRMMMLSQREKSLPATRVCPAYGCEGPFIRHSHHGPDREHPSSIRGRFQDDPP
jgi:hypothetical protein